MAIDDITLDALGCDLKDKINEIIDALNTTTGGTVGVPVGAIIDYTGDPEDPAKWDAAGVGVVGSEYESFALCWGQSLTGATATDGAGIALTAAPDIRGQVIVQRDPLQAEFANIGDDGGEKMHLLTATESGLRTHNHQYTTPAGSGGSITGSGSWLQSQSDTSMVKKVDNVSGRDGAQPAINAHNNLQPYIVFEKIIRYK